MYIEMFCNFTEPSDDSINYQNLRQITFYQPSTNITFNSIEEIVNSFNYRIKKFDNSVKKF
jgi:hypothetical protein